MSNKNYYNDICNNAVTSYPNILIIGIGNVGRDAIIDMLNYAYPYIKYLSLDYNKKFNFDKSFLKGIDIVIIVGDFHKEGHNNSIFEIVNITYELNILSLIILNNNDTPCNSLFEKLRLIGCSLIIVKPKYSILKGSDYSSLAREAILMLTAFISDGIMRDTLATIIKTVRNFGVSVLGFGSGHGKNRASIATKKCLSYFENIDLYKCEHLYYLIGADDSITGDEVSKIGNTIDPLTNNDADLIFNIVTNNQHKNTIKVSMLACDYHLT